MWRNQFSSEESFESQLLSRPGIFINGAHHARELTTISMNTYLMLKLLYAWVKTESDHSNPDLNMYENMLLESAAIYFLPVVNVDGFKLISDNF
jgi:murein tripeptide amidase MpaA